jgi:hypothetical protein
MENSLFVSRQPLDKFHTYLLDTLIAKHIKDYKHHKIDLDNNLIVFFNETIFGNCMWGKKKFKSISEVIMLGIIPAVAHEVATKTQGDLLRIKLELEINIEKYLGAGHLDKAIEILTSYTLEKLKEDVLLNLTEDKDGGPSVHMIAGRGRSSIQPEGDEVVNIHIHEGARIQDANYQRVAQIIRESQHFPVTIVNSG